MDHLTNLYVAQSQVYSEQSASDFISEAMKLSRTKFVNTNDGIKRFFHMKKKLLLKSSHYKLQRPWTSHGLSEQKIWFIKINNLIESQQAKTYIVVQTFLHVQSAAYILENQTLF